MNIGPFYIEECCTKAGFDGAGKDADEREKETVELVDSLLKEPKEEPKAPEKPQAPEITKEKDESAVEMTAKEKKAAKKAEIKAKRDAAKAKKDAEKA